MGGGRRKFPEGAVRLNYLAQARHEVLARVGGHLGRVLAASLGSHMGSIGKKSQIRLAADIKQGMCKVAANIEVTATFISRDYSGLWRVVGAGCVR